jgi:hypothetical protein
VSENSPRNLPTFEEWCTQYGVQKVEGIELYTEDGLDWQMITTADIPAGTTILYVPGEMVLSSDRVAQELNSISDGGVAAATDQLGRIGGVSSIPKFYLFLKLLMVSFAKLVFTIETQPLKLLILLFATDVLGV